MHILRPCVKHRLRVARGVWRDGAPCIVTRRSPSSRQHGGACGRRATATGAPTAAPMPGAPSARAIRERRRRRAGSEEPDSPERPAGACPARRQAGGAAREPEEPDVRRAGPFPVRDHGIGEDRFPNAGRRVRRGADADGIESTRERRPPARGRGGGGGGRGASAPRRTTPHSGTPRFGSPQHAARRGGAGGRKRSCAPACGRAGRPSRRRWRRPWRGRRSRPRGSR